MPRSGPRPIGWDLLLRRSRTDQPAPYSFNCFNYRPPIGLFQQRLEKTACVILTKRVSLSEPCHAIWLRAMNLLTSRYAASRSRRVLFSGLTPAASQLVKAPRVAESPVNFCRLSQCIQLTSADGTLVDTSWLGEVVGIYCRIAAEGSTRTAKAQPHPACGGPDGLLWHQ